MASKNVRVAATQMACTWNLPGNIESAERLVRSAHAQGAQIILLQELFETPYFCIEINEDYNQLARALEDSTTLQKLSALAKELAVVIPFSWFERAGQVRFNSVAMIDADGAVLGVYRKTHIPDSDGYLEKYYFSPGDTGAKVWRTRYANIGVGICWDQWFPELARAMVLQGAELLLYPTAIGSEPSQPELNSQPHWLRVMQGHAAANQVPVIASNRIGKESSKDGTTTIEFFGSSFICDHTGEVQQQADGSTESVLVHEFDLSDIDYQRQAWGLFRDRRPSQYQALLSLDGQ